jgi:aspartyl-tRNA synthetase
MQKETPPGEKFETVGYLRTRRDVNKKLSFTMLATPKQTYCIQLVSNSNNGGEEAEAHDRLRSLKEWTPVYVRGMLRARRDSPKSETHLGMIINPSYEVNVEFIEPLNRISDDLILKDGTVFGPEQRHLQLRTNQELRENIIFRNQALDTARRHLESIKWTEIETPILFKSTPEGAREFLVPTRQKGLAYALPQSPQQYKQILMASGFTGYFQVARCFRDEDLRADRQPEFTQLDMERAFANEADIMKETELLLRRLWSAMLDQELEAFPHMTYQEAMASYGSDKPDLRYTATVNLADVYFHITILTCGRFIRSPSIFPQTSLAKLHPWKTRS